ncbi:hypothetical protein DL96DRAFT_1650868 [Flagelloscypha sp. PMI_526]|nr:hypothetical protein DL96DRAFT_1650868 [Flagelloscypha sp. PMI_526]
MPPPHKVKCMVCGSLGIEQQSLIKAFRRIHVDPLLDDPVDWINPSFTSRKVPVYFDLLLEVDVKGAKQSVALELANVAYNGAWRDQDSHVQVNMLCFDVTNLNTLDEVATSWLQQIRTSANLHTGPLRDHIRILLVGTRTELRDDENFLDKLRDVRAAPYQKFQGEAYADYLGLSGYVECSTVTMDGVSDVFETAVQLALTPLKKDQIADNRWGVFGSWSRPWLRG